MSDGYSVTPYPGSLPLPTLGAIVRKLKAHGADRGSFVRTAQEGRLPAVAVVMLSASALREVAPVCEALAVTLKQMPGHQLVFRPDVPVPEFFKEIERLGQEWIVGKAGPIVVVCFVGACVTEELCTALTAAGCPTRLI